MRRAFVLAAAMMFVPFAFAAAAVASEDKPDAERIVGTWIYESSDRKNDLFEGDGQTVQLKFEGDNFKLEVLKDGGKVLEIGGTYFLDPKQTPKLFDLTIQGGDGGSNQAFAIYEFTGEKLRIRVRDNNGPRPADFDTPGSDCQTMVFRRDEGAK